MDPKIEKPFRDTFSSFVDALLETIFEAFGFEMAPKLTSELLPFQKTPTMLKYCQSSKILLSLIPERVVLLGPFLDPLRNMRSLDVGVLLYPCGVNLWGLFLTPILKHCF